MHIEHIIVPLVWQMFWIIAIYYTQKSKQFATDFLVENKKENHFRANIEPHQVRYYHFLFHFCFVQQNRRHRCRHFQNGKSE